VCQLSAPRNHLRLGLAHHALSSGALGHTPPAGCQGGLLSVFIIVSKPAGPQPAGEAS